jgi:hypothetical protein
VSLFRIRSDVIHHTPQIAPALAALITDGTRGPAVSVPRFRYGRTCTIGWSRGVWLMRAFPSFASVRL